MFPALQLSLDCNLKQHLESRNTLGTRNKAQNSLKHIGVTRTRKLTSTLSPWFQTQKYSKSSLKCWFKVNQLRIVIFILSGRGGSVTVRACVRAYVCVHCWGLFLRKSADGSRGSVWFHHAVFLPALFTLKCLWWVWVWVCVCVRVRVFRCADVSKLWCTETQQVPAGYNPHCLLGVLPLC